MWAVWVIAGIAVVVLSYMIGISLYAKGMKKKRLLYPLEDTKIGIERDIEFKRAGDRSLLMDLYRPLDGEKPPVVILVHGEGAESFIRDAKDWAVFRDYGRLLAQKGLATVTFNHRPGGIAAGFKDIDKAAGDVTDLVAYVRGRAGEWDIDGERICVWAFSAGGVYMSRFLINTPVYIKCLVSFYGLLDVRSFVKDGALTGYYPEHYLNKGTATPILIAKAGKDSNRLIVAADHFLEVARAKDIPVEYREHPEGKHAFDTMNDDETTRRLIGDAIAFIKENI